MSCRQTNFLNITAEFQPSITHSEPVHCNGLLIADRSLLLLSGRRPWETDLRHRAVRHGQRRNTGAIRDQGSRGSDDRGESQGHPLPEMPQSAIDSCAVDDVLPAEAIAGDRFRTGRTSSRAQQRDGFAGF